MKLVAYLMVFIFFSSLAFIFYEASLFELISIDTLVLSAVIIICTNKIIAAIKGQSND